MEQLPRLKARIADLQELRDLFKALRALAAAHVGEAQAALAGIRQYVQTIEDAIAEGAALLAEVDGRESPVPQASGSVLIVVTSEHGFAGAFNDDLLDRAEKVRLSGQDLAIVGRRGEVLAGERGHDVAWRFPMTTHVGGVGAVTRRVAARLGNVATADIIFASYRTGGRFEVVSKRILPLDPTLLVSSRTRTPPLHHLAPEVLLQRLASEYLVAELTQAITESLASENAARLRMTEVADRNIGDKLEDLGRREHTLRQEEITAELLDLVTGTQAILGE